MKAFLFLCLFFVTPVFLPAQRNYAEALQQGQSAAQKGDYETALKKYRAAQAFDPTKRAIVDQEIDQAFAGIRRQRDEAIKAKERAERAEKIARDLVQQVEAEKQIALAEKEKASSAEQKATAVLEKIYFYQGRFGLAFDKETDRYGFIDKALTVKIPFRYEEALPFNHNGHARVRNGLTYYLIDTLGEEYPLATELEQLDSTILALDLRRRGLTGIPLVVFKHPQLKVLLLDDNRLVDLPPAIGKLTQLQMLDLAGNQLDSLPAEIRNLTRLRSLYLEDNRLNRLSAEIGHLPNLQKLNLSNNKLAGLPVEIGELSNLEELDLSDNRLHSLPPPIAKLIKLRALNLNENDFNSLPVEIGKLSNLETLDLGDNQLNQLPVEILKLDNLAHLDLGENPFSAGVVAALRKSIAWSVIAWQAPPSPEDLIREMATDLDDMVKLVAADEAALQANPADSLKTEAADNYAILCFIQILARQPSAAEQNLRRGLALDSTAFYIQALLPPMLLLQGKITEARPLFLAWKDQPAKNFLFDFDIDNMEDVYWSVLKSFEKAGIIPPERAADVAASKKLLND